MSIFRDFGRNAKMHGAPATVGLVIAMIAGFLALWMRLLPVEVANQLGFMTFDAWSKPWTFVTYAFLSDSFIGVFFLCLWLWGVGGSVERELGTTRFLAVWFIFSILCAFGLWLGSVAFGTAAGMWGGWTPVAAITVIWGTRNPDLPVTLMFVLPITGRWLAWLSAALVFFGATPPQLAPFAAAPLALAYFFAANRFPFLTYSGVPRRPKGENAAGARKVYRQEYYDEVKRREKAREEKERLRKLFEQSMVDDSEQEK